MTYLLAAVLLLMATAAGAVTGGVQVTAVPANLTPSVGSSFDVAVVADNVTDLGGFQFQYGYDYMRLQVESVTVNPLFDQVVKADAIPALPLESVAAAVYDNPPVSGTGVVLATIRFRVLIASSSSVSLSGVVLGKVGGTEIPAVASGASVTGNNPPVASPGSLATTSGVPVSGTLSGSDLDGNPLTFAVVGQGSLGSAVITDPATGAFTYTPNAGASGTDTFTFTVNDGFVDSAPATVTVAIGVGGPYTVSTTTTGSGTGSVDGAGIYGGGATATLTAIPDLSSLFAGWSGDCSGTVSPVTITVDGPKNCTAAFNLKQITVTGSVSSGSGSVTCTTAPFGSTSVCTATPSPGYHLAGVTGCGAGTTAGTSYTTAPVTADCTVTATFAAGALFTDDFASGLNQAHWSPGGNQPLYQLDTTQGDVRIGKGAGGSGGVDNAFVRFGHEIRGDFDISVDYRNAALSPNTGTPGNQAQLAVDLPPQSLAIVRSDESGFGNQYHLWADPPRNWTGTTVPTSDLAGTLRLTRVGATVAAYGNGAFLYSYDYGTQPVTSLRLMLQNNGTTDPVAVTWDNFSAVADDIVIPAPFAFPQQAGVSPATTVLSAPVQVAGIKTTAGIAVTGGEYEVNGSGTWSSVPGIVALNDAVRVRHLSSATYAGTVTTTLDIGGTVGTFTSVTGDSLPPGDGTVTATPAAGAVTVGWGGFTDSGSGIAGYILVADTAGYPVDCSATSPLYSGAATTFIQTGVAQGIQLFYRVCARDVAGNVSAGATATATPLVPTYPLSVASAGSGTGTVTSGDAAISCGTVCSAAYGSGTPVSLTATPTGGSTFAGWSGDCAGTAPTTNITVAAPATCTATFAAAVPPAPRLSLPVDGLFLSAPGTMEVKIANTGTAPLAVSSFSVTGPDAASFSVAPGGTTPCGTILAAGSACSCVVSFAPVVPGDPTGRGYFTGRLEVASDDPAMPLALVTVSGASGVTMPQPVAFDLVPTDWSVTDSAGTGSVWRQGLGSAVNATGGTGNFFLADGYPGCTATATDLITGPVDFSAVTTPITGRFRSDLSLASGGSATVDVTSDGGAAWTNVWTAPAGGLPGPRVETVDISAVAAGKAAVQFRFRYTGCGGRWEIDDAATGDFIQTAALSSAAEDFGALQAGTSSSPRTVTVANTGSVDLAVASVGLTGTDAADFGITRDGCSITILPPGGTCAFEATFTPTGSGAKSASADILTDDPRNPLQAVKLSGTASLGPPGTFRITASAGTGGTITPAGAVDVAAGGTRSFTVAPLPGYHLRDVVVDGVSAGFVGAYTFADLRTDHTISAFFAAPDGDANGDGASDIADVVLALRISVGALPATPEMLLHIDAAPLVVGADGQLIPMPDGKIDVGDAIVLLRRSVGLIAW